MRIHCLSTGRIRRKRGERGLRRYFADDWSEETLPVNVFVVEHDRGVCLFDTGQTARAAEAGYFPRLYPFFRLSRFELAPDDEVGPQLSGLGIDLADVRWVVLSHLHTDHVGGLQLFREAEVFISTTEWRRAQGVGGRLRGYLPQYWPAGLTIRLVEFTGPPIGPFPGSHDLAGDGSLVLVPTPGHTRGHLSMLVETGGRSVFLGGDAALTAARLPQESPIVSRFCKEQRVVFLAAHDDKAAEVVKGDIRGGQNETPHLISTTRGGGDLQ